MWIVPRLRLALARRPWLYWLAVAVCAAVVALQWNGARASMQRARDAWGTARPVVVAEVAAAPGDVVTLAVRSYPEAVVPPEAMAGAPEVAGPLRAARPLVAGQMVLPGDLLEAGTPPAGWVVLAVDPGHAPALAPGQAVAVFVAAQRACDGVVTAADVERIEAAVPPDCAAAAADALLSGSVVLARLP